MVEQISVSLMNVSAATQSLQADIEETNTKKYVTEALN
jgi:hypothetical protein